MLNMFPPDSINDKNKNSLLVPFNTQSQLNESSSGHCSLVNKLIVIYSISPASHSEHIWTQQCIVYIYGIVYITIYSILYITIYSIYYYI